MPYVLSINGIIIGLIFIVVGGIITLLSLKTLMYCSYKTDTSAYDKCLDKCFG